MNSPQHYAVTETFFRLPTETRTPSPSEPKNPPTTFKPTSAAVYAQHSRGLWQPINSPIFIVMMSTFSFTDNAPYGGTVVPLAHCSSLHNAQLNLVALAHHCGAGEVTKDVNWGHYFEVKGKKRMRSFWIKEVAHASSLKLMDLDEFDGGLGDDWIGEGPVAEDEDDAEKAAAAEAIDSACVDALTADDVVDGDILGNLQH